MNIKYYIDYFSCPTSEIKETYKTYYLNTIKEIVCRRNILVNFFRNFTLVVHLLSGLIVTPIAFLLYLRGYRFVVVSMRSIGGIAVLDAFIRENYLNKKTPRHKLFVAPAFPQVVNPYAYSLYKAHATILFSTWSRLLLLPFFMNPFFKDDIYRFLGNDNFRAQNIKDGFQWCRLQMNYAQYEDSFGSEPLINIKEKDVKEGWNIVKDYLQQGEKYVALHVRDGGYYNDAGSIRSEKRNADVFTYEAAIAYLIGKNYKVVRMGDPYMVDIKSLLDKYGAGIFDYAKSDIKSDLMDCFLIANSEFVIGSPSGLSPFASMFGKSLCLVNFFTASNCLGVRKGDITTFKKFRYKHDGSLVPFNELMYKPFCPNPGPRELDKIKVYIEDNTEQEIYDTVKEYVEGRPFSPSALQIKAKKMMIPSNYSYGAQGYHSNTVLRQYSL